MTVDGSAPPRTAADAKVRRPTAAWLRSRFAAGDLLDSPATRGDGWLLRPAAQIRAASVLIPVIERDEVLSVLFTVRAAHLYDHAGQISFPGGRAEPDDATACDAALRETAEEIGLGRERVEVLGTLEDYATVTGYRVTPVVGLVRAPFALRLDAAEVAQSFEVPLAFLLDADNHQRNVVVDGGRVRHYYAFSFGDHYIWGATAGMAMNLCRRLGVATP